MLRVAIVDDEAGVRGELAGMVSRFADERGEQIVASCYADASLAKAELGWTAQNGIREMCEDSWRWQKNNPNGYDD